MASYSLSYLIHSFATFHILDHVIVFVHHENISHNYFRNIMSRCWKNIQNSVSTHELCSLVCMYLHTRVLATTHSNNTCHGSSCSAGQSHTKLCMQQIQMAFTGGPGLQCKDITSRQADRIGSSYIRRQIFTENTLIIDNIVHWFNF